MITLLFLIMLIGVFTKLLVWSIKAAWGITKVILFIVLFPILLIGLFVAGFIPLVLIVLVIAGAISLIGSKAA